MLRFPVSPGEAAKAGSGYDLCSCPDSKPQNLIFSNSVCLDKTIDFDFSFFYTSFQQNLFTYKMCFFLRGKKTINYVLWSFKFLVSWTLDFVFYCSFSPNTNQFWIFRKILKIDHVKFEPSLQSQRKIHRHIRDPGFKKTSIQW